MARPQRAASRRTAAMLAAGLTASAAGATLAAVPATGEASVRHPVAGVRTITVNGNPGQAAVDRTTKTAWVGQGTALVRISEATQRVVTRIRYGSYFAAVDPKRGLVWAVDQLHGTIAKVSERTNKIVRTLNMGTTMEGIAVDPRTATVWVTTSAGNLLEISESTGRVLHTMTLTGTRRVPFSVAVDSSRGAVWVVIGGDGRNPAPGLIAEVRESTHKVVRKVLPGISTASLAVDQSAGTVLAATDTGVQVIRESTGAVRQLSSAANNGDGIAVDPPARKVLVTGTAGASGYVLILNERTGALIRKIKVGFFPHWPAIDAVSGNAYVPIAFRGVVAQFRM